MSEDMIEKIKESVSCFLEKEYSELVLCFMNNEKLVIEGEQKIRVVINWGDMVNNPIDKLISEFEGDVSEIDWYDLFIQLPMKNKVIDRSTLYPNMGFHAQKYAEFFFRYEMLSESDFDMREFVVGDVKVSISEPTDIFKFLNKNIEEDDHFYDWNNFYTIKLEGVDKTDFKQHIDQAIYNIMKNNPSIYENDYPMIFKFIGENDIYSNVEICAEGKEGNCVFSKAQYSEAISFYNAARRISHEDIISFLYYYKVIEHFFIVNRKEEILTLVRDETDPNELIKKLTNIYKMDEKSCLRYLLKNNTIESKIKKNVTEAFNNKLISADSIDVFIEALYLRRNSIVHGKRDSGFELLAPDVIQFLNGDDAWIKYVHDIALCCINLFCYNENK